MNTETAIILTVGSIAGSILVTQLLQMNWFKKEKFKFDLKRQTKIDNIELKKLKKDLGVTGKKSIDEGSSPGGLLDVIQNLDMDKIKALSGMVQKDDYGEDEEEGEEDLMDKIVNYAKNNPEVAQQFLSNLDIGGKQQNKQKYLGE